MCTRTQVWHAWQSRDVMPCFCTTGEMRGWALAEWQSAMRATLGNANKSIDPGEGSAGHRACVLAYRSASEDRT